MLFELEKLLRSKYPDVEDLLTPVSETIISSAKQIRIPMGTRILKENESCQTFMWLLDGVVRVFKNSPGGREITLYRVVPGDLCVLSLHCLLHKEGFPADTVAETEIFGLMLDEKAFDKAVNDSNKFCRYLLNDLSQRVSKVMNLISEISFQRLELRLACLLGQLFEQSKGKPLLITHVQLAHELGTAREVISRILKQLERQKCIRLTRGEINLVSREELAWLTRL